MPTKITDEIWQSLLSKAEQNLSRAHSPYSNYQVSAALLSSDGRIFQGVNVENASYGLTICAERSAIVSAVSQGSRQFGAMAIVASGPSLPVPCGACRQVILEFAPDLPVLCRCSEGKQKRFAMSELLPHAFSFCSTD